ncbi:hypothetical protein TPL01_26120 [Sulfuriferula plumbiphila]|uniref:Uncharacterized protein n=1 Tax=Sulfuriferula plumbiphila TaxID=171865 RepID=A0A512LAG7_9PROT|nr:hypothetical protein SFPGR_23810 [Sulfuriferula plumbiphila]GEP31474.1 hypothetical protein TPL01_26120 [Sulfuriferula plumbiphila]
MVVAIVLLLSVVDWTDFTARLTGLVAFALPQAINVTNAILVNMRLFNFRLLGEFYLV